MKIVSSIGLLTLGLCFTVGCTQSTPKSVFKTTIDSYYQAHPACLWTSEQTLPATVSAGDATNDGYDALVAQGLLTRTAAAHHESTYAISAQGQPFWVGDPNHSGSGNICYGHREVVSIDHASAVPNQPGYSAMVSYHYLIVGAPAWASDARIQAAFPKLNDYAASQMSIATLTDTNSGWQMTPPAGSGASQSASAANEPADSSGTAMH